MIDPLDADTWATLFEQSPIGIVIHDAEGRVTAANRRAEVLLGDGPEGVITGSGTAAREPAPGWTALDEEQRPLRGAQHPVTRVLRTGEPIRGLVLRPATAAGPSTRWLRLDARVVRRTEDEAIHAVVVTLQDITAQRQERARLQDREHRYRMLFSKSLSVMLIIDPASGRILDANPAACQFYGYTHPELTRAHIWDLNVLSEQEVRAEMSRARERERRRFEFRHRLADGQQRDVEVFSSPVPWEDREALHSIIHDVTELRRFRQGLRWQNRELALRHRVMALTTEGRTGESILAGVGEAIGRILEANLVVVTRWCPLPPQDPWGLAHHPDPDRAAEVAPLARRIAEAMASTPETLPTLSVLAEGFPAEQWPVPPPAVRAAVRQLSANPALIATLPVSERARAAFVVFWEPPAGELTGRGTLLRQAVDELESAFIRRELERTRRLLAAAMEQTDEAVVLTDRDGVIEYVNSAFERITGYAFEEVVGQNPRLLKSGRHDEAFYQRLWGTLTAGQVWKGHLVNRRKDGREFTEDALIAPIRDATGTIRHYLGLKRDVTREQEVLRLHQQSQRLESIGRLAGGIAHDFNNHLATILAATSVVRSELSGDHPAHEDLEMVHHTARRASELVRRLLVFSRREDQEPEVFELNDFTVDSQRLLRRLIGPEIELVVLPASQPTYVELDQSQLEQVILNLAVNARDAMPTGGKLTLQISTPWEGDARPIPQPLPMEDGAALATRFATLSISDTGIGIPAEIRDQVFEPFFTTKREEGGTGLGLSTSFAIISKAGGYLLLRTTPPTEPGSTFDILLPRAPGLESPPSPAPTTGATAVSDRRLGDGRLVLLVDDEATFRRFTARSLRRLGMEVLEANSGYDALDREAQSERPVDLVVTDVFMPGLGGQELTSRLLERRPDLPVILISGYHEGHRQLPTAWRDRVRYLSKPFSLETLSETIRELLPDQG